MAKFKKMFILIFALLVVMSLLMVGCVDPKYDGDDAGNGDGTGAGGDGTGEDGTGGDGTGGDVTGGDGTGGDVTGGDKTPTPGPGELPFVPNNPVNPE